MKKIFPKILAVATLCVLFVSCTNVKDIQFALATKTVSISTVSLTTTPTATQTIPFTATPVVTPTVSEQIGIEDFGPLCTNSSDILGSEISPNGKWIAAECYYENRSANSPLQVVNKDQSKNWKIYFRDYIKENIDYGSKNIIIPYHWSKDGSFLYAVSPSIASGCCWIGGKYVLLVRLNLETGEQTELPNEKGIGASFTISEDDRFLLYTTNYDKSYDFTVLDLFSRETRIVKLEKPEYIDLESAIMSPYEDIIVLPYFKNIEANDFIVTSLVLIDLRTNGQRILVSNLSEGKELYPIHWMNKEHVIISNANPFVQHYSYEPPIEYWLLNIHTSLLERVDKP